MQKINYMGVENGAREIPGRVFLALKLAQHGWTSVIGHKDVVQEVVDRGPPGVFVYKNTHKMAASRFLRAKMRGNFTIALEEEILNFVSSDIWSQHQLDYQFHPDVMPYVDAYAASNLADIEVANKRASPALVLNLGNLRAAYSRVVKSIDSKRSAGQGILVNGRLGTITGPRLFELILFNQSAVGFESAVKNIAPVVAEECEALLNIVRFIEDVKNKMPVTFRKHPAEYIDLYQKILHPPVRLDTGMQPVQHQFMDNKYVLGFSCTTLIEAVLAGKLVINGGGESKHLISDRAMNRVSLTDFQNEGKISLVNEDLIECELLNPSTILDRWTSFYENLSPQNLISSVQPKPIKLDQYASLRYGRYGLDEIKVDASMFAALYGKKFPTPRIQLSAQWIVVSPN